MLDRKNTHAMMFRLRWFILTLCVLWTGVVLLSLIVDSYREYMDAREGAKIENRTTFNKDIAYRQWSAGHGGVYVPVTDASPPNPYLAHIAERDITTPSGRELTLVNPAYMTRQVHEIGAGRYGVQGHITSLNPIRPENAPDAWERAALEAIASGQVPEVSMIASIDGEDYMRLMQPLVTEEGCLKCHAQQGYQLGDLRGGISISTPMGPHLAIARSSVISLAIAHSGLWLLGLGGIAYGGRRFGQQLIKQQKVAEEREGLLKVVSAKNEELESIVYITSHDLRSPLINISGFVAMLDRSCKNITDIVKDLDLSDEVSRQILSIVNEDIPESLGFIDAGTQKLKSLLDGLLQVSRVGTHDVRIETLDMNKLIHDITDAFAFQITEQGASVTVEELPDCRGDEKLINQVFSNIVDNALKYSNPGKGASIRITGRADDKECLYCIEDNGIGIHKDHQSKLFEMFHRLNPDDSTGGQGLGLTIAKRALDRNDGRVWVESEPGKGSRFFVSLPAAKT